MVRGLRVGYERRCRVGGGRSGAVNWEGGRQIADKRSVWWAGFSRSRGPFLRACFPRVVTPWSLYENGRHPKEGAVLAHRLLTLSPSRPDPSPTFTRPASSSAAGTLPTAWLSSLRFGYASAESRTHPTLYITPSASEAGNSIALPTLSTAYIPQPLATLPKHTVNRLTSRTGPSAKPLPLPATYSPDTYIAR